MAEDASVGIIRSPTPPSVALELKAIGIGEAFKATPPDIATFAREPLSCAPVGVLGWLRSVIKGVSRF
jgi:hypothetical protein